MISRGPNKAKAGSSAKDEDEAESDDEVADSLQVRLAEMMSVGRCRERSVSTRLSSSV